jgi:hypothetical protein
VIGHFLPDHEVAGEAGVRPYIYVASVEGSIATRIDRRAITRLRDRLTGGAISVESISTRIGSSVLLRSCCRP